MSALAKVRRNVRYRPSFKVSWTAVCKEHSFTEKHETHNGAHIAKAAHNREAHR